MSTLVLTTAIQHFGHRLELFAWWSPPNLWLRNLWCPLKRGLFIVFFSCLSSCEWWNHLNLGSVVPLLQVSFGLHTAERLILHAEDKIMRAGASFTKCLGQQVGLLVTACWIWWMWLLFNKKQICIVYKNYMDDTFSVDMFSPSLDQFVFILILDMPKANELARMYFLARKN